jgi:hypothetical protein
MEEDAQVIFIIVFLNALVVLLDIYVEVINRSVTHPWMLLTEHPSYLKGKHSMTEILALLCYRCGYMEM